MTLRQQIEALQDNIKLIDRHLEVNKTLSIVYSNFDRSVLPELDKARNELTLVLVDLTQQLTDAQNAENDLIKEFNKMV